MSRHFTGDIGQLIQMPFGLKYHHYLEQNYLPEYLAITIDTRVAPLRKEQINNNPSNIITIGDSFSHMEIRGYQNYMTYLSGEKVYNIRVKLGTNQFSVVAALINSEIIDSFNCHTIILQIVDREAIEKLSRMDFELLYKAKEAEVTHQTVNTNKDSDLYNLCAFIRLRIGYENPVLQRNLTHKCFTHSYFSRKLFHFHDDMNFLYTSKTDIDKAVENLIRLNEKVLEKGINFIFLLAADKYDVYRPFITDDFLPVDTTTDELSEILGVCVISTKPLLQDMVRDGEQDVYMLHDSHWSYKASEAVAREVIRHISLMNCEPALY